MRLEDKNMSKLGFYL